MKQPELVRLLLHKAEQDEAVLAELLPHQRFDDETVGFPAQQALDVGYLMVPATGFEPVRC